MPRLADPVAAPLLRRIWAAAVPDRETSDTLADLQASGAALTAELNVLDIYLKTPPAPSPDLEAIAERSGAEVSATLAAGIAAAARLSAVFERYRITHPPSDPAHERTMVQRLREPSLGLVIKSQRFMAATHVRAEDASRVAAAFATYGASFMLVFSDPERTVIRSSFPPARDAITKDKPRTFLEASARTPCGPMCAVPP